MTVLKRIRKGAYECGDYLVVHVRWTNEKWDGPRDSYRGWQVYRAGSAIERRLLLDTFRTLADAHRFIRNQKD